MAQTDRDALAALYDVTDGDNWKQKNNWKSDAPLLEWFGVEKVNDQGRVMELAHNNLRGPIPPELGNLGALEILRLAGNQLVGPIPPELGNLGALKKLHLASNQLVGHIPPELGNLDALEELDLGDNQLTGQIPEILGALSKLKKLRLNDNQLSGELPASLVQGGNLKELSVVNNKLSVMPRLFAEGAIQLQYQLLGLRDNPWKQPPARVVNAGMVAAISYYNDLKNFGSTSSNRLKIVLVGLANAGKTSIAIRLDSPAGCLPTTEERTVGVEIRDIKLGPRPLSPSAKAKVNGIAMGDIELEAGEARVGDELDAKLWDFAGQRAYYETHQLFLTQDALFVLVVDMSEYSEKNTREDALEQWLDILQSRVPGSVVLLVGTHSDRFEDPAVLSDRMKLFKEDVHEVLKRLRRECEFLKMRVKSDVVAGKGKNFQPLRVVVEEVLALDLNSPGTEEIGRLKDLIKHVAYNGCMRVDDKRDHYSFPSVGTVVPKPYPFAFATLEAVRRGVELRKLGGDPVKIAEKLLNVYPAKRRPFIKFSDALQRFIAILDEGGGAEATGGPEGNERVFLEAIQLYEDQGAILLTCADGNGKYQCDKSTRGTTASTANLVIHVNPAYFADVVRRIADIRLVEPLQQDSVRQVLLYQHPECDYELTQQHVRFFQAGEVSKEYLKFLWLRDMKLGGASKGAPPLVMTDEDISIWVESLLDVGFMFKVRDEDGGVVADRYVVASCLPDHVPYKANPVEMLGLQKGGALFTKELQVVGAHGVPPGLVPRFLAWCGRGNAPIDAYWKQGVCLTLDEHLVLVYQRKTAGTAFLDCHAMGVVHEEKGRRAVEKVASELARLVDDERYGFPGIFLAAKGDAAKKPVETDDDLQSLLKKLGDAMKDYMNVKFEELERKSETIAEGVRKCLEEGQQALSASLVEGQRAVISRLDSIAAVTNECLLVSIKEEVPCPRLFIIEPDSSPASPVASTSRFSHFRRETMDTLLRTMGQSPPVRLRVRFLCAHDYSAAKCGEDGLGYKLEVTKWQEWLRKCLPLVQVSLFLLRVGISVVARADILPVSTLVDKLRDVIGEDAAGLIEKVDLESLHQPCGDDHASRVGKSMEVFGVAYKNLLQLVEEEEKKIAERTSAIDNRVVQDLGAGATSGVSGSSPVPSRWRRTLLPACCSGPPNSSSASSGGGSGISVLAPVSTVRSAGERTFETDMVLATRVRGSSAPERAWVRKDNKRAWEDFE